MLSLFKPVIEKKLTVLAKHLTKLDPNSLTLVGSIPPLLFFVFVITGHLAAAAFVMPFFIIDLLDGTVARLSGRTSSFGEFLDSTLDRVSDFLIISAFGFGHFVRFEIVIIFLFAAFMVSYTRSRGELAAAKKISFNLGLMERSERLIGIFLALIIYILAPVFGIGSFNILELAFIILAILSVITFMQRVMHAYKSL